MRKGIEMFPSSDWRVSLKNTKKFKSAKKPATFKKIKERNGSITMLRERLTNPAAHSSSRQFYKQSELSNVKMISDETLRLISQPFIVGSILHCIPFKWDSERKLLVLKNPWLPFFICFGNVYGTLVGLIYLWLRLSHRASEKVLDKSISTVGSAFLLLAIGIQTDYLIQGEKYYVLYNATIM